MDQCAMLKQTVLYRESNLACARIILAEPEQYEGLMREWAERVLGPEKRLPDVKKGY